MLEEYNKTLGNSFGHAEDPATAQQSIVDKSDAYIDVMFKMAMANAYLEQMSKSAAEGYGFIRRIRRSPRGIDWYVGLQAKMYGILDYVIEHYVLHKIELYHFPSKITANQGLLFSKLSCLC